MSNQTPPDGPPGSMRSPIRPSVQPPTNAAPPRLPTPPAQQSPRVELPNTPPPIDAASALQDLRKRMEQIADAFAGGDINKKQFQTMYEKYSESRSIIEKLVARNPETEAWRNVPTSGYTKILMPQFEARPLYYLVFCVQRREPLMSGGSAPPEENTITPLARQVLAMTNRPPSGLGRKPLAMDKWMILATGAYAATGVIFSYEPSVSQARLVRDLHADFERANQAALARGWISPERMVFPQRALIDNSPNP